MSRVTCILSLLVGTVFVPSVLAQSPSHRPTPTYTNHIDYPCPRTEPIQRRLGASTYVYLHSLPPRLDDSRRRYRSRLFLTIDPLVPTRLLHDLPSNRLRTELELLWTPRRASDGPVDKVSDDVANIDPWVLLSQRRFSFAKQRFIDLAIASPDDPNPKLGYALAMLALGDVQGAQFALFKAIELADALPILPALEGVAQRDLLESLIDSLREAADHWPRHAIIQLSLAIVLSIDDQSESALGHARRALELRPFDQALARLIELLDAPKLEK